MRKTISIIKISLVLIWVFLLSLLSGFIFFEDIASSIINIQDLSEMENAFVFIFAALLAFTGIAFKIGKKLDEPKDFEEEKLLVEKTNLSKKLSPVEQARLEAKQKEFRVREEERKKAKELRQQEELLKFQAQEVKKEKAKLNKIAKEESKRKARLAKMEAQINGTKLPKVKEPQYKLLGLTGIKISK
jgi:hypothetical protein